MSRALRVAVPPDVAAASPYSGHGRMWVRVLTELVDRATVVVREPGRWRLRRPDVWLADGQRPPPEVDEPLVVQLHGAPYAQPELAALVDPVDEAAARASAAAARVVVTPSQAARRELVDGLGVAADRIVVAPHGADLARFRPGIGGGAALTGERRYVVFVGALEPRTNLPALRDAMAGRPEPLVVVASARADRQADAGYAAAVTAGLTILRRIEDQPLAEVIAGAAALCAPSLWEGFGLPALEAMACGVPVVAADRGGLPEVVGDAGLLVEPDPDALAAALTRVLDDPVLAADLGRRGRERALGYPWSRTADGWLAALERAALSR